MTQNQTRPMTLTEVINLRGIEARCLYQMRGEDGQYRPAAEWPTTSRDEGDRPPVAACFRCGGWTSFGGMSQYATNRLPIQGRTGCAC